VPVGDARGRPAQIFGASFYEVARMLAEEPLAQLPAGRSIG